MVFKPDEFAKHYKDYLDFKDPTLNVSIPFKLLESEQYYEHQIKDAILRTYYFPFFIFGFFTKLMFFIPEKEEPLTIILSRDKPTNGTTYIFEIIKLVKEISKVLGEDINKLGEVKEEEFQESDWVGRSWSIENLTFRLVRLNGHFQLYIDLK